MDFDARVEVYDAGGFIAVDVASEDTALFIGQKGETIDALQYLVNVAAFKERAFFKRIVLDAEGYRQRRVEAIQGMAHRTARRAVREHRTVEMPPMNSRNAASSTCTSRRTQTSPPRAKVPATAAGSWFLPT